MSHKISLTHLSEDKFDIAQNGKTIRIDAAPEDVSTGVRPKALILSALAGCTAIDVVELLRKMRVEFTDFKIDVEAELTEEHPKTYKTVNLVYYIKLNTPADRDKMEKAVNLSQEKYCGVTAMVKAFAELHVKVMYL